MVKPWRPCVSTSDNELDTSYWHKCFLQLSSKYKWIAFFDMDQYLAPLREDYMHEVLKDYDKLAGWWCHTASWVTPACPPAVAACAAAPPAATAAPPPCTRGAGRGRWCRPHSSTRRPCAQSHGHATLQRIGPPAYLPPHPVVHDSTAPLSGRLR